MARLAETVIERIKQDIYTPAGETDNPNLHAVRDLFMHMLHGDSNAHVMANPRVESYRNR